MIFCAYFHYQRLEHKLLDLNAQILVADESVEFNHPLFIQSLEIKFKTGVIVIIHKRLKNKQCVNAGRSNFIMALNAINPTQ